MRVMSFDLSTKCIGLVMADLDHAGDITLMRSFPIIPAANNAATDLGFMASKKKMPVSLNSDTLLNTYWKQGEMWVSKSEKKKRDRAVRALSNSFHLSNLADKMDVIIRTVKPEIINVEKNAMFNGILTIEILAKLSGQLLGIAASNGATVNEYSVATVRKDHNVAKLVMDYMGTLAPEQRLAVKDASKAALRHKMQQKYNKYGLVLHTDDEGDACVVFDYWYRTTHKKNKGE